ncbi:MAG TPA: TIGR04255 family protein [Bryobacterales bacterium]|nr:TIGR04255 family protein [Bryobacterales bacterium]
MNSATVTPAHYSRAPITEAVIDLRVELPADVGLPDLAALHGRVKDRYPKRREQFEVTGEFAVGEIPQAKASRAQVGYAFVSTDEKQIVVVRPNAFIFSRLAPYDRWEALRDEARRLWDEYKLALHPVHISRVGVRYINKIDIPAGGAGVDLKHYFRTYPEIAPELPQQMTNYFMRLEVAQREPEGMVVIHQANVPPPAANTVSILLDIDVSVADVKLDEDVAWERVEKLRHSKNRVFESCITDRVRELIK